MKYLILLLSLIFLGSCDENDEYEDLMLFERVNIEEINGADKNKHQFVNGAAVNLRYNWNERNGLVSGNYEIETTIKTDKWEAGKTFYLTVHYKDIPSENFQLRKGSWLFPIPTSKRFIEIKKAAQLMKDHVSALEIATSTETIKITNRNELKEYLSFRSVILKESNTFLEIEFKLDCLLKNKTGSKTIRFYDTNILYRLL